MKWQVMIWDFQRPRKPDPHRVTSGFRTPVPTLGGRIYQILDGGTGHFFAGGWSSFWGDDCGSHRFIVVGPHCREQPFCNALVISARIGVGMSDKVSIPPVNTRATQTVLQIDQIDGGVWAGNGEGNKDRPTPGVVGRDGNRALLLEQKTVT